MQWEFVIALVVAVPFVLFPVVFIWYLNISGMYAAIREARKKRAALAEKHRVVMAEQR